MSTPITEDLFELDSEGDLKFNAGALRNMFPDARYYYILSGRSWGKTYPVLREAVKDNLAGEGAFAYVRRYDKSLKQSKLETLAAAQAENVEKYSEGKFNRLKYWRGFFRYERVEQLENGSFERAAQAEKACGAVSSINTWENDKGPDFGADKNGVKHIILDEALSKGGRYLPDEWGDFKQVVSTYIRTRYKKDTKIWFLANPVSKWTNPYFQNLGITKAMYSKPGITEIVYPHNDGAKPMKTVFCYLGADDNTGKNIPPAQLKTYETFFAFPNSNAAAMTFGLWEMDEAPVLPAGVYKDSTKNRTVYFKFMEEFLACDIMRYDRTGIYYLFIYPGKKRIDGSYLITLDMSLEKRDIIGLKTGHPITEVLNKIYRTGQVYYSDFATADAFHGFIKTAKDRRI